MEKVLIYLKMKKLLQKNSFQFAIISILAQGFSFLIPLFVAKILAPDLFGKYSLSMMIVYLFIAFLIGSFKTPFIINSGIEKRDNNKMNKSFSVWLVSIVFSIIVFTITLLLFKTQIAKFVGFEKGIYQLIFIFIGLIINNFFVTLFLANNEKRKSAFSSAIFSFLNITIILSFWYFNELDLIKIFQSFFISGLILIPLFFRKKYFKLIFPIEFNKEIFNEIFCFAKWQIFGLTAVYLVNWGDNIVLRSFVSFEEIGIYNFAYKIFSGIIGLILLINTYFLPIITRNIDDKKFIKNYFQKTQKKLFLRGSILIVLALIIFSLLIMLFFKEYNKSILMIWTLGISLFFILHYTFYIPYLNAKKKYKFLQTTNIIQVIINILLGFLLVPYIGLMGVAISTIIGYIFRFVALELYYKKTIQFF